MSCVNYTLCMFRIQLYCVKTCILHYMMLILFSICNILGSSIVKIQFAQNLDLYLVTYNRTTESHTLPMFTVSSLVQIRNIHHLCAKAALRQIDYNTFEIYFCGYKMCLNRQTNELALCINEEHNTKWEIQKLDIGRTYALRNNDFCITLKNKKVIMEPCHEGVSLEQIVHIIPDKEKSKFFVSDDDTTAKRKRMFEEKLYDNEDAFRKESILYGEEFVSGPRKWNLDTRFRMN